MDEILISRGEDDFYNSLLDSKKNLKKFLDLNGYKSIEPDFTKWTGKEGIEKFKAYLETDMYLDGDRRVSEFLRANGVSVSFSTRLSHIYTNSEGEKLFIFYVNGNDEKDETSKGSIGVAVVKKLMDICLREKIERGIIFSRLSLSPSSVRLLSDVEPGKFKLSNNEKTYKFSYINDNNFIDLNRFSFAPKIVKIFRGKKATEYLDNNTAESGKNLPKIPRDDPLSIWNLLSPGDILIAHLHIYCPDLIYKELPEVYRIV